MSINSVVNDLVTSVSVINALKPLPPTISGYSVAGKDDLALDPAGGQTVQINGTGFLPGATITFDGSAVAVVTYVNPNQLTFTSPAKTAGTYTIYAVNPDGGTAIYVPGIIYSTLPTWTTAAGSLGSYYETTSISNTVVAAGDAPVTYSLFSGSLPTGSTLSANGVITGTAPVDSSSTTYSFTIQATDAQLQDSTRSFSLTINVDAVTWVSPANNTTYTSAVDSAISTVTLSATDAAGYNVSYSANALPTGLSLSGANISGTPTVIADSSTLLTATAATTNRTAVRTINWSITVANDVYFEYNTLLIPGASTTFVDDASTNNFAVTINGDTKPNNFNPYTPGYYSNYFDGTGDDLSLTMTGGLGAGDFTLEYWFYPTSLYNYITTFSTTRGATGFNVGTDSAGLLVWYSSSARQIQGGTIVANQWHHAAFVRSGSTLTGYLNGVSVGTATVTTNFSDTSARIGSLSGGGGENITGYLSNVRVVVGTAVYTANFTPSTTPLTAIANTTLLTCQSNRFIDNSTNNFTITVAGNTSISSFDPFVPNSSYSTYGSGYFDGTGDYLTVPDSATLEPGSSDFTIECFIYPTANGSYLGVFSKRTQNASDYSPIQLLINNGTMVAAASTTGVSWAIVVTASSSPPLNTWSHIAVVRNGTGSNNLVLYLNGISVGAGSLSSTSLVNNSAAWAIGADAAPGTGAFIGYISDFRSVIGTAVYTTTFTPPSAPLTAISGTSLLTLQNNQSVNNNVFLDNSTNNFFVTRNGNTTQGTFSPYGGNWSNYFDGTGDYLQTTGSSALTLDGNFTIEAWVYQTASNTYASIIASASASWTAGATNFFILASGNVPHLSTNPAAAGQIINGGTIVNNTWNHIAVSRTGTTASMWVNGTRVANVTLNATFNLNHNSGTKLGGGTWDGNGGYFFGYISNVRVIKGTDIYGISNTSITVPTTPLTPIANTSLLTCADNRLIDDGPNNFTITKNGDVSVQRFSPFNPSSLTPTSYSGYFDGTGDVLTPPANNVFAFGTGSFCIEAWIFNNVLKNYSCLVTTRPNNGNYGDAYHIGWDSVGGVSLYVNATSTTGAPAGTITTGQWQHFVCCRDSSNRTAIFVNGTRVGNDTVTSNFTRNLLGIGDFPTTPAEGINGYISNLRLVKGNSVYDPTQTTITVPTSPLTTTSQGVTASTVSILTCQSPTFIDNSTNNFTISAFGNSQPTQQNPFGFTSATTNGYTVSTIGGSGYFDGTGDYLTVDHSTAFNLSGIAFTIEAWVYTITSSGYRNILTKRPASAGPSYQIWINNTDNKIGIGNATTPQYSNSQITTNTWNHVAWTYDGSATSKMWINGVLDTTVTLSPSADNANPITIGAWGLNGSEYFNGYITDVRIVKGSQVYTTAFIPPATPSTAIQNTVLLNNMTSAGIYDSAMMNNMETVSDAKLSTAVSKFGGSSMYFDGTGDGLLAQSSPNLSMGDGNFTIEFWYYPTTTAGTNPAIMCNSNGTPAFVAGLWALHAPHSTHANKYSLWVASYANNQALLVSSSNIATNTWSFITITRSGNTWRMFVNGTIEATATHAGVLDNGGGYPLYIGYQPNADAGRYITGYIDDLRMTKGYARYTSNFTAPTVAFPVY